MTIDGLLAQLKGVRRSGAGWAAFCPAHADTNPSLSIVERDGKILIHCHAGCSHEAVLAALGIGARELFSDSPTQPRIVAEYEYLDEHGNVLFVVERRDPKGFRQRRPDGKGGWVWNLQDARRVLYRLPELAQVDSVVVCEGEKDCEVARGLGLAATCNPGGAGKWRDEYSDALGGKAAVIIADADEPGRKHAQQVAASLMGKARSVKVVELPGSKDLSDWVEAGGNREALLGFIEARPEWTPAKSAVANGFTLTPLGDLLAQPDVPVDYVLENRLVAGTVSIVVAKPKVGKSTFARNLCLAVARGESFLGMKSKGGECIYLALEERAEDVRADFRAMGADGSEPIQVHAATAPAAGIASLCNLIRERRPVLVVVDPLFRLARIRDEKAYAETYDALGPVIDAARDAGTHVLLVHHAGKSLKADAIDSPLGSTALGGVVSAIIVMKRTDAYRTLQSVQRIGTDMPETVLEFDAETRRLCVGESRIDADRRGCEDAILTFLSTADGPQTQAQIREGVEGKTRTIRAALTALAESRRIAKSGEGTRGKPFLYELRFSGSHDLSGTGEPELRNGAQRLSDVSRIVVPTRAEESFLVPEVASSKPGKENEI